MPLKLFWKWGKIMDKLNEELLRRVLEHPRGSMRDIIRPYLGQKSENALRNRIRNLAAFGYITLDNTSTTNRVLCKITPKGKDYLENSGRC